MSKFVCFFVLLLITVAVGENEHEHGHHEDEKHGPCGKFSTERMLTHNLRHCEKAAKNVYAPVSSQCCKAVEKVSIPCLHAIFASGAFQQVGINPEIAITIPRRCHHHF
ncbi:uncharacterized protein LOC113851278 [Abrus precatorius]|uniref:Uncharacterized protein LOC113851278 n=1 Tax=Abrus precatorius TaxID=3816 RepID=A0A8B8K2B1_ABRPR|nr:uncharacterized protein LOC113851278 [Abrus precatorius]